MTCQDRAITRNRERLACTECRRRKLKCSRSLPCSACTRRGAVDSCVYQRHAETGLHAEERLEQLETMVRGLVGRSEPRPSTTVRIASPSPPVGADSSLSTIGAGSASSSLEAGSSSYTDGAVSSSSAIRADSSSSGVDQHFPGSTHWSSALDDIQELKSAITAGHASQSDASHKPTAYQQERGALGILFGSSPSSMSLDDVLATCLPPRQAVDRLVSAYFQAQSLAAPFNHSQHFRRRYASFWADPRAASPLWVSLLFSVCHISANALSTTVANGSGSGTTAGIDNVDAGCFASAAARCLVLGEYFRPQPYAVEALVLLIQSHCVASPMLPPDMAPALGVLIRVATAMGYHQSSSSPSSSSSPFEGEMRRRTWSICMQLDLLVSFHLGLPGAMRYSSWPCLPPSNLTDADFDEASPALPPPRPPTEPTGMVFVIAKHNFMVIFDKIQQHALSAGSANPPAHSQEMERDLAALDAELAAVHAALPQTLLPTPMRDSVFDPPSIIVTRLCVSFLHCKCLVVLHRPHVLANRAASLRACHAAAALLVADFCDAAAEFAPGGRVERERWFMSSLTAHDFLLGAVALCLVALAGARSGASYVVDAGEAVRLLTRAGDVAARLEGPSSSGASSGASSLAVGSRDAGHVRSVIGETIEHLRASEAASSREEGAGGVMDWDFGPLDAADSLWDEFLAQYLHLDGEGVVPVDEA